MTQYVHFPAALDHVLGMEGSYSNDPRDKGGATNYGISLAFAQQLARDDAEWREILDVDRDGTVSEKDISRLTLETAKAIYLHEFWEKYRCYLLPPPAGLMFFSFVVNMPPRAATLILQRAVNYATGRKVILEDGLLGGKTLGAAQRCNPAELCKRLDACASMHYADLGEKQPYYEGGWQYRSADALWAAACEFFKLNRAEVPNVRK